MDWALGIAVENGRLVVERFGRGGDFDIGDIAELGGSGVPTCSELVKHKGTLDFGSLKANKADEYLRALGFPLLKQSTNRHMVFAGEFDGVQVVIPALVMMRALFRPTKFLLPLMFRPQVMDRVRFLDFTRTPIEVVVDATWSGACRTGDEVRQCISWMTFFPSAIRLASSVHEFAMRGEIGMTMPNGSARATMAGLKIGGVLFVTEMRVVTVHADEEPILAASGCTRDFVLIDVCRDGPSKGSLSEISKIPIGQDGDLDVSDLEWTAIEPTLLAGQRRLGETINQRHLFDAILQKINFGTSWRALVPKSSSGNNARFAERSWSSRATLLPSLEILRNLRN
jgi:hypothetical protein